MSFFFLISLFFSNPRLGLSELKLQLQSSFEIEDSTPEDRSSVDPDTPVNPLPDLEAEPADTQLTESVEESVATASLDRPADPILNSSCPLSEKLRDLRLETRR